MDIVAMLTKDIGVLLRINYTNIERLLERGIISENEAELLRRFNGLRNAIVHKYDKLDLVVVKEGLHKIDELYNVVVRLIERYEALSS